MGGAQGKLFTIPTGFDPIDTSFTKRSVLTNGSNAPLVSDEAFFTLSYIQSQNRYGFTIYAPGNPSLSADRAIGPLHGAFTGDVPSAQIVDGSLEADILKARFYIFILERLVGLSNSPASSSRVVLKSQKINGETLRPEGNSVVLVPPKPGDLLGTVVFFNIFAVAQEQQAVTAAGAKATAGAHVFYMEQTAACRSTSLKAFHVNLETGKKNSGFSTLLGCTDELIQPGNKFLYGLSAQAIPGT